MAGCSFKPVPTIWVLPDRMCVVHGDVDYNRHYTVEDLLKGSFHSYAGTPPATVLNGNLVGKATYDQIKPTGSSAGYQGVRARGARAPRRR